MRWQLSPSNFPLLPFNVTLTGLLSGDHLIKLSIAHGLSQSTKLCVFEERVLEIVAQTKDLPEILAETGTAMVSFKSRAAFPMYSPHSDLVCGT